MTTSKEKIIKGSHKIAKKAVPKIEKILEVEGNPKAPTAFATSVYNKCKQIPSGRVSTYKGIANALNNPNASRAVGSALKRNPFAPVVPCHRVVASDRTLGGFHGSTDLSGSLLKKKKEMLKKEEVSFEENGKVSEACLHSF